MFGIIYEIRNDNFITHFSARNCLKKQVYNIYFRMEKVKIYYFKGLKNNSNLILRLRYDCCHYYPSILMTQVRCSILNDWTTILMDQVFENDRNKFKRGINFDSEKRGFWWMWIFRYGMEFLKETRKRSVISAWRDAPRWMQRISKYPSLFLHYCSDNKSLSNWLRETTLNIIVLFETRIFSTIDNFCSYPGETS